MLQVFEQSGERRIVRDEDDQTAIPVERDPRFLEVADAQSRSDADSDRLHRTADHRLILLGDRGHLDETNMLR